MSSGVGQNLVENPRINVKEVGEGNWEEEVKEWWLEKGRLESLLVKSEQKHKISTATAEIRNLKKNSDWTKINFSVESSEKVPVLVKFTHLPGWSAKENGENLEIHTASPHLMLVYAKGEVEFSYRKLWYQHLGAIISGFTALLVVFKLVQKFRPNKRK
jgi:hypothetical protein